MSFVKVYKMSEEHKLKIAIVIFISALFISGTAYAGQRLLQSGKTTTLRAPNNNGLVGYWSMEDATGTKATDFSGNGNTGTLNSFAAPATATSGWGQGKFGKGLIYDGINDYVSVADSSSLDALTTSFTVTAWAKRAVSGTYHIVYDSGSNSNHWFFQIGIDNVVTFTKSGIADYKANTAITDTNWHHIAVVKNGNGSSNITIYLDAAVDSGALSAGSVATPSGTKTVGSLNDGSLNFQGTLDDVRVYNRALSAAEISALYSSGQARINAPSNNGLQLYFSMEDSTGTKTTDFSGSGNTGSLGASTAAPAWTGGIFGKGLSFDGSNDYLSAGTAGISGSTGSISGWFYYSGNSAIDTDWVPWSMVGSGNDKLYLTVETYDLGGILGHSPRLVLTFSNVAVYAYTPAITPNQWYNFVATWDTSAGVQIYLNGVQGSVLGTNTYPAQSGFGTQYFGTYSPSNAPFQGKLDDIRIYNRVLSSAEISNLYNNAR